MNRKQRKLNYIRTKNRIRRGEPLRCFCMISLEYHHDEFMDFLSESISKAQDRYSKLYKSELRFNDDVVVGQDADAFMKRLLIARFSFTVV